LDGWMFRVTIPRVWVHADKTQGGEDEPADRFACFRRIPPECLEIENAPNVWEPVADVLKRIDTR
jgi:hypothetical protein